jgi:two-component system copper resistance phosphate regulon response regulator CusR
MAATAKLLLVEDQITAAHYLARGLREEGIEVELAHSGTEGLARLLAGDFELAILDVMLPGLNGWSILEQARRSGIRTPVMFLTARDDVADRVRGLELGADDYLVKPFSFAELLARVRVILRRVADAPAPSEPTGFELGDLRIDLIARHAWRGEQRLDLTPKEFALLTLMLRHAGEVQSRASIAERVWGIRFDTTTNVVEVAIRRLRTKVDDPFPVKLLHTERGAGYVLALRP